MFRFEKLEVWKLAIMYGNSIYDISETFPKHEDFGLKSQLKRAALSISSNIAEGSGSSSNKDFCNFLDISIKSCIETVSQLKFAQLRGYISEDSVTNLYSDAESLIKKIQSLKHYLKKPRATGHELRARKESFNV